MINNTIFPFYTSTAQQDANRVNTPVPRICPRERLLPFQIQRSHNTSAVQSIKLIDCDGGETSLGTGYFSSVGTTIASGSLGVAQFTSVDYIQYDGMPLETELPYGVYYLELKDNYGTYYSEHFSVRNLNENLITGQYGRDGWVEFTISGATNILTAISSATAAWARTAQFGFGIGDKIHFACDLNYASGQYPRVVLRNTAQTRDYSDTVTLKDGLNDAILTATLSATASGVQLFLINTAASQWAMPWSYVRRNYGDYIKVEFSNTDDLRHSNGDDIMYATGGFKQRAYLPTRLNLPSHEPIEVGEELDGVFIAEQLNSTYLYSIIDYVSRSMYNGMQYLPLHDSITIVDEVGNEYSPAVGNIEITMNWNTFDTGSLRIEFNDGSMTWVNDQENIT